MCIRDRHWIKRRFFDAEPSPEILAMTTNYLCNEWLDEADKRVFETMKRQLSLIHISLSACSSAKTHSNSVSLVIAHTSFFKSPRLSEERRPKNFKSR